MTWRDLAFLVLGAAGAWLCAEIKIQRFIRSYTRAAWLSDHPGQTPPSG